MVIFAFHGTGKSTFAKETGSIDWDNDMLFFSRDIVTRKILPDLALATGFNFLNVRKEYLNFFIALNLPYLIVLPKKEAFCLEHLKKRDPVYQREAWNKQYLDILNFVEEKNILNFCYWLDLQKYEFISLQYQKIITEFYRVNENNLILNIIKDINALENFLEKFRTNNIKNSEDYFFYREAIRGIGALKENLDSWSTEQKREEI